MNLDLVQVETLCQRLYSSQLAQEREEAEKLLSPLGQNKEHLFTCREILDKSLSPFAQLFAATSFRRLTTEHDFAPNVRLEMRNYVLEYLITHVDGLEGYVTASLIRLVCRIVRIGWFEELQHRQIVESCRKLILAPASMGQYLLGAQILEGLIVEMNMSHRNGRSPFPGSRKTSMAFRDDELMKVFQIALDALNQAKSVGTEERYTLMEAGLKLAIACMMFDFIGSGYDESSDEPNTIQALDLSHQSRPGLVELCFYLYGLDKLHISRLAIDLLVHISSVRRSIFPNENDRRKFLTRLVETSLAILKDNLHLQDVQNFNSFCKFLGRLKANFNLLDLVSMTVFREWIEAVTAFTIKSLTQWQCASGSMIHLVALWARMATSLSFVKVDDSCRLIESKIPDIVHAYINSRMECVLGARNGVIDDPLEDEGSVQEQLDSFHQLCRFKYASTHEILKQYMEPLMQQASQLANPVQMAVVEGKLTWIVHIIACIIKGRPSAPSELSDTTDGDLSSRMFSLCHVLQQGHHAQRSNEVTRQRLDLAILSFLDSFRIAYIAENRLASSKLYLRMSENYGDASTTLKNEQLLELIVDRVVWNLQFYASVPSLITPSLRLFRDVATTFLSSKALPKLTTVKKLLSGSSSDFVFLNEPGNARNRTLFYSIITRLLFSEDVLAKFQSFVAPIHQVLEGLRSFSSVEGLRSNVPANTVVGVFRDLRGLLEATISDRYYSFIFDWLHSHYFPVIVNCVEAWVDQPDVTTPILKFMTEFAYNRNNRISFGVCSPNGYLLFRLVSQVVVAYGRRVVHFPKEGNQYRLRFKGTWICFLFFSRALIGNYANFGVFQLYGDPALNSAMEATFNMMTMLSAKDVVEYKKLGKAYFPLLDKLMENHMDYIAKLDFQSFRTLMTTLEAGLQSFDTSFCSTCSAAVDKLATYYYTYSLIADVTGVGVCISYVVAPSGFVLNVPEAATSLDRLIQMWPNLFPTLLRTLIDIALFEEASAMWSLSQPILALIVINESWFAQIKEDLVREQPEERQKHVIQCLAKLMEDIERTLDPKNRENFSHNLSALKHGFKGKKRPKKKGAASGSGPRVWRIYTS